MKLPQIFEAAAHIAAPVVQQASVARPATLPIGRHNFEIVSSEIKTASSGSGSFISFGVKIIDCEHSGLIGAYRLNLYHSNPVVVEIAQKQLAQLCGIAGLLSIEDTDQLVGTKFLGEVGAQKSNPSFTEIKRTMPILPKAASSAPEAQVAIPQVVVEAPVASQAPAVNPAAFAQASKIPVPAWAMGGEDVNY
jgi:hypothetical protein